MSDVSHRAVLQLLMSTAELGMVITRGMAEASQEPELTENLPLVVMCTLDLDGPCRPSGIQELIGLSSGGVTKLLDRMEARGVVARAYGTVPDDHRAVMVSITSYGRKVLRSMTSGAAHMLPEVRVIAETMMGVLDTV